MSAERGALVLVLGGGVGGCTPLYVGPLGVAAGVLRVTDAPERHGVGGVGIACLENRLTLGAFHVEHAAVRPADRAARGAPVDRP
jgi:hypothetical protein